MILECAIVLKWVQQTLCTCICTYYLVLISYNRPESEKEKRYICRSFIYKIQTNKEKSYLKLSVDKNVLVKAWVDTGQRVIQRVNQETKQGLHGIHRHTL